MKIRPIFLILALIVAIGIIPQINPGYSTAAGTSVAAPDEDFKGDIHLYYKGKEVKTSEEPRYIGGNVFIPVKDLTTAFGMFYTLHNDQYLIFYKSNVYIKFDLEKAVGWINGKSFSLVSAPFKSNGKYFVPINFFCKALSLDIQWTPNVGKFEILSGQASERYAFSNQEAFFKRAFIDEDGTSVSIPMHWQRLDKVKRSYGYIDEYEHFALSLQTRKMDASETLETFEDDYRKELMVNSGATLQFQRINKITETKVDSYAIYLINKASKKKLQQVVYLFLKDRTGYILTFTYGDSIDDGSAQNIISAISKSFQINHLTIDENDEHYIEYSNFFSNNMQLTSPIHSNKVVASHFELKGTASGGLEALRVIVSKGAESMEFLVPVKNRAFNKRIYLPFGLGKHNIYIENATAGFFEREGRDMEFEPLITYTKDNLLQFSIINSSSKPIRYLIPTVRVPSDEQGISDMANLVTYKDIGHYKKARAIYLYIIKNIRFDAESTRFERTSQKVIKSEIGNEEELAYLYAAMLRSIEIPSRVVSGEFDGETHFWNEIMINGKWIVSDLGSEYLKGDGITAYFNLNRDEKYSSFKNIKITEY